MFRERVADNLNEHSLATRLRRERFRLLLGMIDDAVGPVTILDIGGRPQYWDMMLAGVELKAQLHITLVNPEAHEVSRPNFTAMIGDGRAMPQFRDQQFDIVFSNSTIEHVGDLDDQRRMAGEVRRLGRRYYVQTPNRLFPIEPHFLFPAFQFLPMAWRVWLVQHFSLGWFPRIRDRRGALEAVTGIRLMNRREVEELFPDATIYEEKWHGLIKSFVAYTPDSHD
jgi:SAM-dependent methyltransferase